MTEVNDIQNSKLNTTLDTGNPVLISDQLGQFSTELKSYENTGYKIILDLPILQTSRDPLFVIDTLGYNPGSCDDNPPDFAWSTLMANESLVQPYFTGTNVVKILKHSKQNLSQLMYDTHRYVLGTPRYALKISSSTNVTGNLFITEVSGVYKQYYDQGQRYLGLVSQNMALNNYDHDKNSFITVDLSLNRVIKINPMDRKMTRSFDMALLKQTLMAQEDLTQNGHAFAQYFPRDLIVVGPLTNLAVPGEGTGQVTLELFADYTTVQFHEPLLPLFSPTYTNSKHEVLKFSDTFVNKSVNIRIKDAEWLPGT